MPNFSIICSSSLGKDRCLMSVPHSHLTKVFVKYGDVNVVDSPACLPGTGKRRAESGLFKRTARVATSSNKDAISSTEMSPASGNVSNPVPQTAEYRNN